MGVVNTINNNFHQRFPISVLIKKAICAVSQAGIAHGRIDGKNINLELIRKAFAEMYKGKIANGLDKNAYKSIKKINFIFH